MRRLPDKTNHNYRISYGKTFLFFSNLFLFPCVEAPLGVKLTGSIVSALFTVKICVIFSVHVCVCVFVCAEWVRGRQRDSIFNRSYLWKLKTTNDDTCNLFQKSKIKCIVLSLRYTWRTHTYTYTSIPRVGHTPCRRRLKNLGNRFRKHKKTIDSQKEIK